MSDNATKIIRVKHNKENPYVMLNKKSIWDLNLSLEAVGLWTRLMSRPDDWEIRISELINSCKEGKDKIHKIINELIKNKYIYRHQERVSGKRKNQFSKVVYYIFETQATDEEIKKMFPQPENPDPEIPAPEVPAPEKPPLLNKDNTSIPNTYSDLTKEREERDPLSFPEKKRKIKESKVSFGKFVALREGEYETLCQEMGKAKVDHYIKALENYVPNRKEGPYKDYAAAIRTWFDRDKSKGGPTINEKIEELPQDNSQKIIQNRAISERIKGILDPVCTATKYLRVHKDQVAIVFKEKGINLTLLYWQDNFLHRFITYLLQIWPEKQNEIEKISLQSNNELYGLG